jgi:hypothetical protein
MESLDLRNWLAPPRTSIGAVITNCLSYMDLRPSQDAPQRQAIHGALLLSFKSQPPVVSNWYVVVASLSLIELKQINSPVLRPLSVEGYLKALAVDVAYTISMW